MKDNTIGNPLQTTVDYDVNKKKKVDQPVVTEVTTPNADDNKTTFNKAKNDTSLGMITGKTRDFMSGMEDYVPKGMDKHKNTKVVEYGDILKEIFTFLGGFTMGDPTDLKRHMFSACIPLGKGLDQFAQALLDTGRAGGSMGRRIGFQVTMDSSVEKNETTIGKLQPTPLKNPAPSSSVTALPPFWKFDASANYASDSAKRKKDADGQDADVGNMAQQHRQLAVSLQINGQMGKIKVQIHSMGVQNVVNGQVVNHTGKEFNSYESADNVKGNGSQTKADLEQARFVEGSIQKGGDGYVYEVRSGVDPVVSRYDSENMLPPGQTVAKQFTGKGAKLEGTDVAVTMTANDVLSVTRAYAEVRFQNRQMIVDALQQDPKLAPDIAGDLDKASTELSKLYKQANDNPALKRDPNFLAKVAKAEQTLSAVYERAEQDPRLANVGLEMPTEVQLGRKGPDGQWHGLVGQDGKPVTIKRSELETLLANQKVQNDPGADPSSTVKDPPKPGTTATTQEDPATAQITEDNATALGNGLTMPVTTTTNGETETEDVDLGAPISDTPETDPGVQTIVAATDSRDDAVALQENADTVDQSLIDVAEQLRKGMLPTKDLSADQQKQIADALQNYLKVKDANAAKSLRSMLYSMSKGGSVGNYINAVLKRLDASVRLNTAIDKLPDNLKKHAHSSLDVRTAPEDGYNGSTIHITGKSVESSVDLTQADPKKPAGAELIFKGVIGNVAPKLSPTATATNWGAAIARFAQDMQTSRQMQKASETLAAGVTEQLGLGVKTKDIVEGYGKQFIPDGSSQPTISLKTSDDGTFELSLDTETKVPQGMLDHAKAVFAAKYPGQTMKPGDLQLALTQAMFPNNMQPPKLTVKQSGDDYAVVVSVPLASGKLPANFNPDQQ